MSDEFYLLHIEAYHVTCGGEGREPQYESEMKREQPRCIHKVSGERAKEVAAGVRDGLNPARKKAEPHPPVGSIWDSTYARRLKTAILERTPLWQENPSKRRSEFLNW